MFHAPWFFNSESVIFTYPELKLTPFHPLQKEFSSALTQAPPSLLSFTLTKVHRSGDEDLTRCAARIVTDNPGLKNFTLRMTHGSWFSAASSCGRIRTLGVYEVVSSPATEEGFSTDEFGRKVTAYDSLDSSPPSTIHRGSNMVGYGILHPTDGDFHQAGCSPSTSSLPTALISHEWGQKGISLTGKEFTRHAVYRLTDKEMETCRVQMRDLVRRRLTIEAASYSIASHGGAMSSVSRRSSSASSARSWPSQRYYGFAQWNHGHLAPSGSSFANVGYRFEISPSGTIGSQGRRNRHKHSSSMSSVPQTSSGVNAFGYSYRYQQFGSVEYKPCSVTWADQHASSAMQDNGGMVRDVDDYVFV